MASRGQWVDQLLPAADSLDVHARAELLSTAAAIANETGDNTATLAACDQLMMLLDQIDDPYLHAVSQLIIAFDSPIVDDYERALTASETSLAQLRGQDEPFWTALALNFLGSTEIAVGRYDDAVGHLSEMRALSERLDNTWLTALSMVQLGIVDIAQDRLEDARSLLDGGLDLSLSNASNVVAFYLAAYAWLTLKEGDPERAVLVAGAAEGLRRRTGVRLWPVLRRGEANLKASVRDALGANRFDEVFATGSRLTRQDAVALVPRSSHAAERDVGVSRSRSGTILRAATAPDVVETSACHDQTLNLAPDGRFTRPQAVPRRHIRSARPARARLRRPRSCGTGRRRVSENPTRIRTSDRRCPSRSLPPDPSTRRTPPTMSTCHELHRPAALPPLVIGPLAFAGLRRDQAVTDQRSIDRRAPRHRKERPPCPAGARACAAPTPDAPAATPRSAPRRRGPSDADTTAASTTGRPAPPDRRAAYFRSHSCTVWRAHAVAASHVSDRRPVVQHLEHGLIALLHQSQLHEHAGLLRQLCANDHSEEGRDRPHVDPQHALDCQPGTGALSPRYRNRVPELSTSDRSHGVHHQPWKGWVEFLAARLRVAVRALEDGVARHAHERREEHRLRLEAERGVRTRRNRHDLAVRVEQRPSLELAPHRARRAEGRRPTRPQRSLV